MQAITTIDFSILHFIAENLRTPWMDGVMVFITKLGDGGAIWIFTALCLLMAPKYRKQVPFFLAALIVSFLLGEGIIKNLVERIRPFQVEGAVLLIHAPSGYSFPSGHTATSFACAMALWKINRHMGAAGFTIAGLIGFSRLYLYVHYPTDVLCGIVLGIATAMCLYWLLQNYKNKPSRMEMDTRM